MAKVSIDILANTVGAVRQVQNLERSLNNMGKKMSDVLGRGVGDQGAKGIGNMTREMQRLEKQTQATQQRLALLQRDLKQVQTQRGILGAPGGGAQPAQLRAMEAHQRHLEHQINRTQIRLNSLQATRAGVQGPPGAGGPGGQGGGGAAPGGILGLLGQGAGGAVGAIGSVLGPLGAALGVTAIGGLIAHAVTSAINEEKEQADFAARMLGPVGGLGSQERYNLAVRKSGLGLGYTSAESRQVFEAMSQGGGFLGGQLEADSRTAMQMGRFFGLDAGSQAGMLAAAQRTGAVKPGDARRFAEMLASEIAQTGLGPRAQEVQEATLQLLHMQMGTMPRADASGGIMQLQALLNSSGIAGFQGQFGANFISNLQQRITSTGAPRDEALKQMIFAKMGIRDFLSMEEAKEQGLNDPRFLPTAFSTIRGMSPTPKHARFIMSQAFGISMAQSKALMERFPGGIKPGDMKEAQAILSGGKGKLEAGAAAAMELPGNQLRKIEAALHDIMISAAEPLVEYAADQVSKLTDIWVESKTTADMTTRLAEKALGLEPGTMAPMDFSTFGKGSDSVARMLLPGLNTDEHGNPSSKGAWANFLSKFSSMDPRNPGFYDVRAQRSDAEIEAEDMGPKWKKGWKWRLGWKDEVRRLGGLAGANVSSENRPGARTVTGRTSRHATGRAFDFTGSQAQLGAMFDAIRELYPGQIDELFYTPKGSVKYNKFYKPGSFNPAVEAGHKDHLHVALKDEATARPLRIIIEEHGVVSEQSKAALRQTIRQSIDEHRQGQARVNTNRRNKR